MVGKGYVRAMGEFLTNDSRMRDALGGLIATRTEGRPGGVCRAVVN